MPSLKEVRVRIDSVKSTQQITRAMKMVAASKLRKAQNAILKLRPYASRLNEILQNLSASLDNNDGIYSENRGSQKILIIVIASNRGLCGGFNANVIKHANLLIQKKYQSQLEAGNVSIHCIGKKVVDFYKNRDYNVVGNNIEIFNDLSFDNAVPMAEQFMKEFVAKKYDKIEFVYNQFKNATNQVLINEQFLPIAKDEETKADSFSVDYIFEPSKQEIVEKLIPKSLKIQFYKSLLDSYASEHGARMTAMHKATDNAEDLINDLQLKYNKARQASITNEILEIVGGAEAIKG